MFYHVVFGTVPADREEGAVRFLKTLAEHSNQINPRAVVEIIRRTDAGAKANEYIWLGKLGSMADHEEGGKVFQSDPRTQQLMRDNEELFTVTAEEFYEIV